MSRGAASITQFADTTLTWYEVDRLSDIVSRCDGDVGLEGSLGCS